MKNYQRPPVEEQIKTNKSRQELCLKLQEILYQATKQQRTVEQTKSILTALLAVVSHKEESKLWAKIYENAPDLG